MPYIYYFKSDYNQHHGLGKGFTNVNHLSKHTCTEQLFLTEAEAMLKFRDTVEAIRRDGLVVMNNNPFMMYRQSNISDATVRADLEEGFSHMCTMVDAEPGVMNFSYLIVIGMRPVPADQYAYQEAKIKLAKKGLFGKMVSKLM